ncbi:hypothetical protein [Streptomyces murinus]|uniref:hypothetical protein n=1 Tax=Streptomyces murinus TaxID=33900 RepID=UPI00381194F0
MSNLPRLPQLVHEDALDALELTAAQRARVPEVMAGLLRGMAAEGRPELSAA